MRLTQDVIEQLEDNPNVVSVESGRIRYTDGFRRRCMDAYEQGARPVDIFREAGLGPERIGHKRIERCISRWRRQPPAGDAANPMSPRRVDGQLTIDRDLLHLLDRLRTPLGLSRGQAIDQAVAEWAERHGSDKKDRP